MELGGNLDVVSHYLSWDKLYSNPHCDLLGLKVSLTIYNEVAFLKTSFHAMQHMYKEDSLLTLKTLIQLYKEKAEGEERGQNTPKVTGQVGAEVGLKSVFPSSPDSTLAGQHTLPFKVCLHNEFCVEVWLEGSTYFSQQWPMNKGTKETLEGPL